MCFLSSGSVRGLNNVFRFEEKFIIIKDNNSNSLIISSDIPSQFFNLIREDDELYHQFVIQIIDAFLKYFPTAIDIHLKFVDEYTLEVSYGVTDKSIQDYFSEVGIYANIAANLNITELEELCMNNSQFNKICKSNNFWSEVIKNKYPEYLVQTIDVYDWRKVYHGLDYYINNIENILEDKQYIWNDFIQDYSYTFRYLVLNNIIQYNDKNIDDFIFHYIGYDDEYENELIQYVLDTYKFSDQIYSDLLSTHVYIYNLDTMKTIYEIYKKLGKLDILRRDISETLNDISAPIDVKVLEFISDTLKIDIPLEYLSNLYQQIEDNDENSINITLKLINKYFKNENDHIKIITITLYNIITYYEGNYNKIIKLFARFENMIDQNLLESIIYILEDVKNIYHADEDSLEYNNLKTIFENKLNTLK